ncbi:MAG: MBL fold metallo-hydrolase [Gammaproteobacteria bacterium]
MANPKRRLNANADGNLFVDSTCINCGVSRHYAPELFGDTGTHAYVKRQPQNEAEELAAQQALLACPVGSIGMMQKQDLSAARDSFPMRLADSVFINGFNHRKSYGAHSYFIACSEGNWLIDSPRFIPHLVDAFARSGGLDYIFLTHRDDVCDAHKYAARFNATRIIHRLDADAQEDAELILDGEAQHSIGKAQLIFTPGHTRGHMVLLWDETYLYTGDHFAWIPSLNRFGSFRGVCWYSWEEQIRSVAKLRVSEKVAWVFPGHGKWGPIPQGQFPQIIEDAVQWMRRIQ